MESEACNTQKCGEFRQFVTTFQDCCSVKRSPVRTPTLVGLITVICPSRNTTITQETNRQLSQCVMANEMKN